jgi:hypothetical protein
VEVDVEVECRPEALYQRHGSGRHNSGKSRGACN